MSLRRNIAKSIQAALVLLALVCPVSCFNRLQEPEIDSGKDTDPDIVEPSPDSLIATKGATYSLAMQIDAGDAEDGFEWGDENDMGSTGSNYVILFAGDKNKKLYDIRDMVSFRDNGEHGHGNNYIERTFYARFTVNETEEFPKYCLVVLNGRHFRDKVEALKTDPDAGVDAVLGIIDSAAETENGPNTDVIGREGGYYTMTNSMYSDGGLVEITEEYIHETAAGTYIDWDALKDEEIVHIHVERMVAKFTLELTGPDGRFKRPTDDSEGFGIYTPKEDYRDLNQNHQIDLCVGWNNEYTYTDGSGKEPITTNDWEPVTEKRNWKARIVGWGMNAQETESHVFKQDGGDTDNEKFRSYWAIDPHYDGDYPWQFRRAVDRTLNWYGNKDGWTNLLRNYSWNDSHLNNAPGTSVYTPENTYNYSNDTFQSGFEDRVRMNLHAGTHLIVRAQLLVQEEVGSDNYITLDTLYRDRDGVYYRTARECVWSLIRSFNHALASQTKMAYRYYDWNSSTDTPPTYYAVPTTSYKDLPDTGATKANVVDAEEDAPQIGDEAKYRLYYEGRELTFSYTDGPHLYYGGEELDEKQCRELLAEAYIKNGDGKRLLNATNKFGIYKPDGKDLIALPIYSEYDVGNTVVIPEEGGSLSFESKKREKRKKNGQNWPIDDNDVQSLIFEWAGAVDYFVEGMMYYPHPVYDSYNANDNTFNSNTRPGVVRNAWYKFTLTGIDNIGIPVHAADQPIVPNWDQLHDKIGIVVDIIGQHEFDWTIKGVLPQEKPDTKDPRQNNPAKDIPAL